jgi:hypothetical protein
LLGLVVRAPCLYVCLHAVAPLRIRPLLWFDCTAAGVVGAATLALSSLLAPLFGLPRSVVVFSGVMNLTYAAFSYSLARRPLAPRGLVEALVVANAAWVVVCVVIAIRFASPGSVLGVGYMLCEGIFVGLLAVAEARALAAARSETVP